MKRHVVFSILLVCSMMILADNYFAQDQVWSYQITDLCAGDEPVVYIHQMRVSGETVIDQTNYLLLESVPIRENGKQVFAYYEGKEVLIYDFGLTVGEQISTPSFSGDDAEAATVVATDTVTLLDGRRAKRIQYDRRAADIEYVGSTSDAGVLAPLEGEVLPPCGGQTFLCCSRNGEPLFETSAGSCEGALFPTLSGLSRTVHNEYLDGCTMQNTTYAVQPIKEVTIEGKQYLQFQECNMCLREADNKVYLYSGEGTEDLVLYDYTLEVGDVLHQIVLHEGEDPTFSYMSEDVQGSIITVTKIESVTLLDGKEYKKWTFDNGMEYVETIGSYGDGSLAGDFFQMVIRPIPTCLLRVNCVCVSRDGQPLYEMPSEEQARLQTHCMSTPLTDELSRGDAVSSYYVLHDGILTADVSVKAIQLYDISGACLLRTTKRSVDLSAFANRLCILHMDLTSGGTTVSKIAVQ